MNHRSLDAGAPQPLTVAVDRELAPSVPEIKYTIETLLRIAGYGCHLVWNDGGTSSDICYGRVPGGPTALHIPSSGRDFTRASEVDAVGSRTWEGMPFLLFPGESWHAGPPGAQPRWPNDAIFAAYWLLVGPRDATWTRDRWDNLDPGAWVPLRDGLLTEAPVSRWGRALRDLFVARGRPALAMPWEAGPTQAAFSFTHDVDYPQIIRWIEAPRLILQRGVRGLGSAWGVMRGTNHFWTFQEWVELERQFGARPTFYFMARQGSLLQYARGRPDDFYDIRQPEFTRLFAELRDAGCEFGLHASFEAYRSAETLRVEAERVSHAVGGPVLGNRHHYWHLDPADPNETLRRQELAGLRYDSTLGLEFHPGWRRGTCHPFRPYHPGERRALNLVEIPPAWMDDHFHRRLAVNGIGDPDAVAARMLGTAQATGGVAVVDYHSRGMNADFYPRYGPWLAQFIAREWNSGLAPRTPGEILAEFRGVDRALATASSDETGPAGGTILPAPTLEISPVGPADTREAAALHFELFGDPDYNGHSVATLGPAFLDAAFYRLNIDNPGLHALVARVEGRVVGFSVYATVEHGVFTHMLRRHFVALGLAVLRSLGTRPSRLAALIANLKYMRSESLPFLRGIPGWWVVAGVHPDARSPVFEARIGARVAAQMFDTMETHMRQLGCPAWYGVVRPDNAAINTFLQRRGAEEAGMAIAQGMHMRYYIKRLAATTPVAPHPKAR